jgi:hypothetical protein
VAPLVEQYLGLMEKIKLKDGIRTAMNVSFAGNKFFQVRDRAADQAHGSISRWPSAWKQWHACTSWLHCSAWWHDGRVAYAVCGCLSALTSRHWAWALTINV